MQESSQVQGIKSIVLLDEFGQKLPIQRIKLYWYIGSPFSLALKSMLISGNVPHVDKHVDMMKGEHKSAEILRINPNGTLPILVADGNVLLESAAILRLLASSQPTLRYLYPDDSFQQYKIDSILDFCGTSLSPTIVNSLRIYIEALKNKQSISEEGKDKLSQNLPLIYQEICHLEFNVIEDQQSFACGENLSIADFQLFFQILILEQIRVSLDVFPKLAKWKQSCSKLKGFKQINELWQTKINQKIQLKLFQEEDKDCIWIFFHDDTINPFILKNKFLKILYGVPAQLEFDDQTLDDYQELEYQSKSSLYRWNHIKGEYTYNTYGVVFRVEQTQKNMFDYVFRHKEKALGKAYINDTQLIVVNYYKNLKENMYQNGMPPQQHIDTIIEGAKYFGCKMLFIDMLKKIKAKPRKNPANFKTLEIPENSKFSFMTIDEIKNHVNPNSYMEYLMTVNGKVIKYTGDNHNLNQIFYNNKHILHMELIFPQWNYDPYYGWPEKLEDCSKEYSAMIEDYIVTEFIPQLYFKWEAVCQFKQEFRD